MTSSSIISPSGIKPLTSNRHLSVGSFAVRLRNYQPVPREYPSDFHIVQTYVQNAVKMKHELKVAHKTSSSVVDMRSATCQSQLRGYDTICDQIKKQDEPSMLYKVLLALAYGETLGYLTSYPSHHAKLLHLILKMDPFAPPQSLLRTKQQDTQDPNYKSGPNSRTNELEFFSNYLITDAHLALCLAIISANSTFSIPVLESVVRFWSKPGFTVGSIAPRGSSSSSSDDAVASRISEIVGNIDHGER